MISISIVTGTYNRIRQLRNLVDSVRRSVGRGLSYEIVVVDGGSSDGTQAWCNLQSDISLIEQGKLLGAVKAFNEGAYAARGKYVVLANDDITFIYEALLRAYVFMEDNPTVGIGCFYQDRHNKPMHVDRMSAITESGERVSTYYGQVCIVPKWLGDKVGWWGDYLHTYGGDNELSCNVIEQGYSVTPIECACIHDVVYKDALRQINNPDRSGTHSDSLAFRSKWPNGPTLRPLLSREIIRRTRLLYAPIYEPGNAIQHKTKYGLLKSLRRYYDVTEIDFMAKVSQHSLNSKGIDDLYYAADAFKPNIFLLQAHDARNMPLDIVQKLKSEHPASIFISWNGDYNPRNFADPQYHQLLAMMDLATFCTVDIFPTLREKSINCEYWQIGYEEFKEIPDRPNDKRYSVIFQGNEYSEQRTYLGHILRGIPGSGIFGQWKSIKADGNSSNDFAIQDKLYRCSDICISDQQFPNSIGYVSNRLFQAMRSGSFVLQQHIPQMEKYLHMRSGEHLVEWYDVSELPSLISYWLGHPEERKRIASAGKELVMREHNFDTRVKELNEMLKTIISRRI